MTKLIDVTHPHFAIRAALQTFTSHRDQQDFDSLKKAEKRDAILNMASDLASYGGELGMDSEDMVALVRTMMARFNMEDLESETVELISPLNDPPEEETNLRSFEKRYAKRHGNGPGGLGA